MNVECGLQFSRTLKELTCNEEVSRVGVENSTILHFPWSESVACRFPPLEIENVIFSRVTLKVNYPFLTSINASRGKE